MKKILVPTSLKSISQQHFQNPGFGYPIRHYLVNNTKNLLDTHVLFMQLNKETQRRSEKWDLLFAKRSNFFRAPNVWIPISRKSCSVKVAKV